MIKPVSYKCFDCGYEHEEWFDSNETIPEELTVHVCPHCDKALSKWNVKNNSQVWKYMDERK